MTAAERIWLIVGFAGQAFFFMRFLVQWIVSERRRESVVPLSFWFFSIGGGGVLLSYAIYRHDPVFIAGQSTGLLIYTRNLMLLRAKARRDAAAASAAAPAREGHDERPRAAASETREQSEMGSTTC